METGLQGRGLAFAQTGAACPGRPAPEATTSAPGTRQPQPAHTLTTSPELLRRRHEQLAAAQNLTRQLSSAASVAEARELFAAHGERFNGIHWSALLTQLARLDAGAVAPAHPRGLQAAAALTSTSCSYSRSELRELVSQQLLPRLGLSLMGLAPRQLAALSGYLAAAARLGYRPPASAMAAILGRCAALMRHELGAEAEAAVVAERAARSRRDEESFGPRELSGVLWALATLGFNPGAAWLGLADRLLLRLAGGEEERGEGKCREAGGAASSMTAAAQAQLAPEMQVQQHQQQQQVVLIEKDENASALPRHDPQSATSTTPPSQPAADPSDWWGEHFAYAGGAACLPTAASSVVEPPKAQSPQLRGRTLQPPWVLLDTRQAATCAWALAKLSHTPPPAVMSALLCHTCGGSGGKRSSTSSLVSGSDSARGTVGSAGRSAGTGGLALRAARAQDLSMLVFALGALRYRPEQSQQAVALLAAMAARMHTASDQDLVVWVAALSRLRLAVPAAWAEAMVRQTAPRLDSLPPLALVNWVAAMAELQTAAVAAPVLEAMAADQGQQGELTDPKQATVSAPSHSPYSNRAVDGVVVRPAAALLRPVLLARLARLSTARLPDLDLEATCRLAWAAARLRVRPGARGLGLVGDGGWVDTLVSSSMDKLERRLQMAQPYEQAQQQPQVQAQQGRGQGPRPAGSQGTRGGQTAGSERTIVSPAVPVVGAEWLLKLVWAVAALLRRHRAGLHRSALRQPLLAHLWNQRLRMRQQLRLAGVPLASLSNTQLLRLVNGMAALYESGRTEGSFGSVSNSSGSGSRGAADDGVASSRATAVSRPPPAAMPPQRQRRMAAALHEYCRQRVEATCGGDDACDVTTAGLLRVTSAWQVDGTHEVAVEQEAGVRKRAG
eukprot:XP_001689454.1 predicted protein [Chlamydomonas reinhardtii]